MSTVHFKVGDTLRRHNKTPAALIEASGLAKTTVYNIVNNKAKAVELETLSKLMAGLRELTEQEVVITDVIEEEAEPDWREEVLNKAKPISLEALRKLTPDWTEEEKKENEAFMDILEERREQDRPYPSKRIRQMLEIMADDDEAVSSR